MDLQAYIISRMRRYNRVNYQYGYVTAEECVFGLAELSALAEYAGRFDLKDALRKKSDKLRDLLPKQGTPAFAEFAQIL